MSDRPRDRLAGFDGMRAIAALSIVVLHAASMTGATRATSPGRYFARLDVGVAVFFVISAFLLYRPFVAVHLGERPPVSLRAFWWRRALRIYPAYWIALTAVILGFRHTHIHGAWDYVRHYLLVQIYRPGYGLGGIVPTWTLAVEVSFYAALPAYAWVLGACTRRLPAARRVQAEIAGVVVVYAIGLVVRLALTSTRGSDAVSARWLPAMADWFAFGLLLAVLRVGAEVVPALGTLRRLADRYSLVCVTLAAAAYVAVCNIGLPVDGTSGTVSQDFRRQLLFGVVGVALVAPAALGYGRSLVQRALEHRAAVAMGTVSYGVFLWHFDWIAQLGRWGAFDWFRSARLVSVLALGLTLALATAAASWIVVERRVLSRKARVGGADATTVPEAAVTVAP